MTADIVKNLAERLAAQKLTVAAAESLTGGGVAAALTSIPGSSSFFMGGIVAYSNQLKVELLGVPVEVLLQHGAVSEECARAMAEGVRRKLNVRAAVATTGIAGPDGGTAAKPVGRVWLAAATEEGTVTLMRDFKGGREDVARASVQEALLLLLSAV